MGHILVDFDKTLAFYESWEKNKSNLGHPIPAMVERVKRWLAAGLEVRIFTARASENSPNWREDVARIQGWCVKFIGMALPVTNQKDMDTLAIWDDLAVTVEPNTGWRWSAEMATRLDGPQDPLTSEEEFFFSEVSVGRKEYAPLKKDYWEAPVDDGFELPTETE